MYNVKATNKKLIRHTQWDDKNKSINTWSMKNKIFSILCVQIDIYLLAYLKRWLTKKIIDLLLVFVSVK